MHRPNPHRRGGSLSALALALTLGWAPAALAQTAAPQPALAPARLQAIRAEQPSRQARAQAHVMNLRAELGLTERDTFAPATAFTTPAGKTVVRLNHTYQGYRVLGSQAIVHVSPEGEMKALPRAVQAGITLSGEPTLAPEVAVAAALKVMAPANPARVTTRVERIVFPVDAAGDLVMTLDPATGRQIPDRTRMVVPIFTGPYMWAYEVQAFEPTGPLGPRLISYTIDGNTGQLLRVMDLMQRVEVTPQQGTGHGRYVGTVFIPTSQMLNGTYALFDPTRGTLPNPWLATWTPDASGWTPSALQVFYSGSDAQGVNDHSMWSYSDNPVNTWGDGHPFTAWGNLGGANGQSAAVDAMWSMATTWDFYAKVLGWNGPDGLGTATYAVVHATDQYTVDNAYWNPFTKQLAVGAGSSTLPPGHPYYDPHGFKEMGDFDVIAHEMTHGVTSPTVNFVNAAGYEEAGMAEGTSDFFSAMIRAWAARPAGAPDNAIPNTFGDWQIGKNITQDGLPLRYLDKPSKDGRNVDAWFDGARFMDGHFSAGIVNRVLYFLSQGASAIPGADNHSPYLPGGMSGIGNDATARIWFATVTERLVGNRGNLTFADCRAEAIAAAKDLYGNGADCLQSQAVERAFSAVNVGLAPGQAPRTQVIFEGFRNGDYMDLSHNTGNPGGFMNTRQYFPCGETVFPKATVLNNANTAFTISLGGPAMFNGSEYYVGKGGRINADGSWTTPWDLGWYDFSATSVADPTQFAENRCFLVNLDSDMDLEVDAMDMGGFAFSWWLGRAISPSHSIFNAPWTDDADVAGFIDAMEATWPVK
ncbi:MAG TPA: M4 family metallopeptidase [Holophagaceae bacterium]|nr:M4 family metallopeptidase [Holophagaceae bacterium]